MASELNRSDSRGRGNRIILSPMVPMLVFVAFSLISQCSSVPFHSTFSADRNWFPIDEYFPSTTNQFYYTREAFNTKINLTDEVLQQIGQQAVTAFHVDFEYWTSTSICPKGIIVFPKQENVEYGRWNQIERLFSRSLSNDDQFEQFFIWPYSQPGCENSLTALRQLNLRYNRYETVPHEVIGDQLSLFKQVNHPSPKPTIIDTTKVSYLYDCDKSCAITLEPKLNPTGKYETIDLEFWHPIGGKLLIGTETVVPEFSLTQFTRVTLQEELIHNFTKANKLEIVIQSEDRSTVSMVIKDDLLSHIQLHGHGTTIETNSELSKFLNEAQSGATVVMLAEYHKSGSIPLVNVDSTPDKWPCYRIHYLMESKSQSRFTLHAQTHKDNETDNHQLFSWIPDVVLASADQDTIEFCVGDYIHPELFQNSKDTAAVPKQNFRIVLSTEGVNNPIRADNQRSLISIEPFAKDATVQSNVPNYLVSTDTEKQIWSSIVPESNPGFLNVINAGKTNQVVTYQLSTVWLSNDPKLSLRPVIVRLNVTDQLESAEKIELVGQICDEIMECLNTTRSILHSDSDYVEYALAFDPHPNLNSTRIKLVLHITVPQVEGTSTRQPFEIDIDLINFGNPCYENNCNGNPNKNCKADPKINEANDFVNACICNEGFMGPECRTVNRCPKVTECSNMNCRNNRDDTDFECVCGNNKPLETWDMSQKKCALWNLEHNGGSFNETLSTWIFPLESINTQIYDVCYKFTGKQKTPLNPSEVISVDISASLEQTQKTSIHLLNTVFSSEFIKETDYFELCLSQLVQYNHTTLEKQQLVVKVVPSNSTVQWDQAAGAIFSQKIVPEYDNDQGTTIDKVGFVVIPKIVGEIVKDDTDNKNNGYVMKIIRFDDKQLNETFPPNAVKPSKLTILSDWIHKQSGLQPDQIKQNQILLSNSYNSKWITLDRLDICRPRLGRYDDCLQLNIPNESNPVNNPNDWNSLLNVFANSDKFQFQLSLTVDNTQPDLFQNDSSLKADISLYNACQLGKVECQNGGTCYSESAIKFRCQCMEGFLGERCQINATASCNPENTANCTALNSKCVPLAEDEYTCQCPIGYNYNGLTKSCDRMRLSLEERFCSRDPMQREPCWLNGTNLMSYLPRHFPQIDSPKDWNKQNLFYSIQSDSRLTITVDDPDKRVATDEFDLCVRFRYYVAPEASVQLMLNSLELFIIRGSVPLHTDDEHGKLSEPQTLCLKSLLNINDQTEIKLDQKFELSFAAKSSSNDDAVSIQIMKYNDESVLELKQVIGGQFEPKRALHFIGTESADQPDATTTSLSYQWPVQFPNERWTLPSANRIEFLKTGSGTKEMATLESYWISRPIHSFSDDLVYLSFNAEIDKSKPIIELRIRLIDIQRKPMVTVAVYNTEELDRDTIVSNNRLRKHFSIPIYSKVKIEQDTIYKVVFEVTYNDTKLSNSQTLFAFNNISFGDPCINPGNSLKKVCYGLDGMSDPKLACKRVTDQTTGEMDYQCDCDVEKGLTGKDCSEKNYCKYMHNVTETMTSETNGNNFCTGQADCKEGGFDNFEFHCICKNQMYYFDFVDQQCKPISKCFTEPCNIETEDCIDFYPNTSDHSLLDRRCDCKKGFSRNTENKQCEPIELCNIDGELCPNPLMKCFSSIGGSFKLCQCPKGFTQVGNQCRSQYCSFPGFHDCSQECNNIDNDPYYECGCNEIYYDRIPTLVPSLKNSSLLVTQYKCELRADAPAECQTCVGKYQVCKLDKCDCIEGFTMDAGNCVPKDLNLACPHGLFKKDESTGEYVCDCNAIDDILEPTENSTSKYWVNDEGTCSLQKSICDEKEAGYAHCTSLGARCHPNPYDLKDYACECFVGTMFPDEKRTLALHDLNIEPLARCYEVCQLPNQQRNCLAIGGSCNPYKLWSKWNGTTLPENTTDYCDCVPGTFFDGTQCQQEFVSLTLEMRFRWTHKLETIIEKRTQQQISLFENAILEDSFWPFKSYNTPRFIDPIGMAEAQKRAYEKNTELEKNVRIRFIDLIRRELILDQSRQIMRSFQLLSHSHLSSASSADKHLDYQYDTETVSFNIDQNDRHNITIVVAVRTNQQQTRFNPQTNNVVINSKLIAQYGNIMESCNKFENDHYCTIPFLSTVLTNPQTLKPNLNQPCNSIEACHGMSDCSPFGNTSFFSCECNRQYFNPVSWFNFKTNEPSVVFKNEQCRAKELCSQCLSKSENQKCLEEEPIFDSKTSSWRKEAKCSCSDGFQHNADNKCVAACLLHSCNSHGRCALDTNQNPVCECDEDFYGTNCENEKKSSTGYIVAVVILSVVLAITLVGALVYFLFFKRNSSTTHSQPHPSSKSPIQTSPLTPSSQHPPTSTTATGKQPPLSSTGGGSSSYSNGNSTMRSGTSNVPSPSEGNVYFQSQQQIRPQPRPAPRQQQQPQEPTGQTSVYTLPPEPSEEEPSFHQHPSQVHGTPIPTFQINSQEMVHFSSENQYQQNGYAPPEPASDPYYAQLNINPAPIIQQNASVDTTGALPPEVIYAELVKKPILRNEPAQQQPSSEYSSKYSTSSFSSDDERNSSFKEEFSPRDGDYEESQQRQPTPYSQPPPPPPPPSLGLSFSPNPDSSQHLPSSHSSSSLSSSSTSTWTSLPPGTAQQTETFPRMRSQSKPTRNDPKLLLESQERPSSFRDVKAKMASLLTFQKHGAYPVLNVDHSAAESS